MPAEYEPVTFGSVGIKRSGCPTVSKKIAKGDGMLVSRSKIFYSLDNNVM